MSTIYFQTYETRPDYFFYYQVTWKSLLEVLRESDRVVLISSGASPAFLEQVPARFNIIHDDSHHTDMWEGFSNFYRLWKHSDGPANEPIAFLDCRDMLFQRNPFDDLLPGLTLLAEGMNHSACQWNRDDQNTVRQNIFDSVPRPMDDWPVLCPGAYGGDRRMVRWMALMVWQMCTMQKKGGTDQGSFNYIANNNLLGGDPDVRISDPLVHDWVLGGHDFRITPATWQDDKIINAKTGRPYALVHQWDRTAWREATIGKYK